ncbi:hypothetical protein BCR37DRAFT_395305 [Protomyces lactucae-debilis]|uniref:Uncharacterized protein n=1 Tax=Protomyces lactucae-debilis TaxID=2754530 RepID=A0A1Y2F077_PROLT|nr:uncharacterized protein BCR37DRAFT_395305 [Protomyces lactucae-debilis]ORY76375.1 hypothetical protein BCR37DRAFT_395305 [Protomyces lactucae-debilis]
MRISILLQTLTLVTCALAIAITPAPGAVSLVTRGNDHIQELFKAGLLPSPGDVLWKRQLCAAPVDKHGRYKLCVTCVRDGIRCAWNSTDKDELDLSCWCVRSPTGRANLIDLNKTGCWGGVMTDSQTCAYNPQPGDARAAANCYLPRGLLETVEILSSVADMFMTNGFKMPPIDQCPLRSLSDHFRYPGPSAGESDDAEEVARRRAIVAANKKANEDAKKAKAAAKAAEKQAKADAKKQKNAAKKAEKQRKAEEKKAEKQRKEEEKKAKKQKGKRDDIDSAEDDDDLDEDEPDTVSMPGPINRSLQLTRDEFAKLRADMAEQMKGAFMLLQLDQASQEFQPVYTANATRGVAEHSRAATGSQQDGFCKQAGCCKASARGGRH